MNVLSVVGARPQFIKAAAVSQQLRCDHDEILVHTGQHYDFDLSGVFFDELALDDPTYNLGVGSDSHTRQTAQMMLELDRIVADESPDVILVYGDTNSTLAGALVGAQSDTLLAHVEAGLRSYDWTMPEEVNRRITDHCSDLLFAPSQDAETTLTQEGVPGDVFVSGDVMYDSVLQVRDRLAEAELDIPIPDEYVLATIHRAKNTDNRHRLAAIVDALSELSMPVVFPAHPRTVNALHEYGLWEQATEGVEILDPLSYVQFLALVAGADCIATDSGGVQKEAFYLDTPCVTIRDSTEWTETIETGWNRLVDTDAAEIVDAIVAADTPSSKPDLYGNGNAAGRIVTQLEQATE